MEVPVAAAPAVPVADIVSKRLEERKEILTGKRVRRMITNYITELRRIKMKTLKRKIVLTLTAFAMCVMFSGCCLKHEWEDATCTTPQTCAKCGETQGEAAGHSWEEATCSAPKTCSVCGKTKGEALDHTWTEATCSAPKTCSVCKATEGEVAPHDFSGASFQVAATCSVCGASDGEPLQADFDKYGYVCYDAAASVNIPYKYQTRCYNDSSIATFGNVILTSYERTTSYGDYTTPEGYEWIVSHFDVVFSDEMAWNYGISARYCTEDYYTIKFHDDTLVYQDDNSKTYTVNFNGKDYTECRSLVTSGFSGWVDYSNTYAIDAAFCVPVGYDGTVIGFYDSANVWGDGQYLYDLNNATTVFYRF